MNLPVGRKERRSPRPYRTRKLDRDVFPGFHPGLFSRLPSGKRDYASAGLGVGEPGDCDLG